MTTETITIASGKLNIITNQLHESYNSVHDLIKFAARENKKRGFLFVSKILGKHIPVKPSVMREAYDTIATMMKNDAPTLVVGLAETATGLGAGVADSLAYMIDSPVVYQHTTRHHIDAPRWFEIAEAHSHAVSHIVYEPLPELMGDMVSSEDLILIDDEISTGKTLLQLAQEYMRKMPKLKTVKMFALVSWLDDEKQAWFEAEMVKFSESTGLTLPELEFHSLMNGSFTFEKDESFQRNLPAKTDKELATEKSSEKYGRRGLKMPCRFDNFEVVKGDSSGSIEGEVSIVGTGEHLFMPFLIAEMTEKSGFDVVFQSTTRSPITVDGKTIGKKEVVEVTRTNSLGEDCPMVNHYIYNLDTDTKQVVVCPETKGVAAWYGNLTDTFAFTQE